MKTKTTIRNAKLDAILTCLKQGLDNRQTFNSVKEQFPTFIIRLDYIRRVRQAVTDTKSYNMDKIVEYMAQKRKGAAEKRTAEKAAISEAAMQIGFDFFTDEALIGELKRRGYSGTITKTISKTI